MLTDGGRRARLRARRARRGSGVLIVVQNLNQAWLEGAAEPDEKAVTVFEGEIEI